MEIEERDSSRFMTGFLLGAIALIFLLMASRRLKSDRFLSHDYRPEIYTKEGIDWVEENTMKSVILRHFPAVAFALDKIEDENAFKPWKTKK